MRPGAELVGPPPKRVAYKLLLGGGHTNAHHHFRWECAACDFRVDECEDEPNPETARQVAQQKANAHTCSFGWSAIPMTDERTMLAAISPYRHNFTVTADDRQRWARRLELKKIAARTADRVVPFPGGPRA